MNCNTQEMDGLSNILTKRSSVWFYFTNHSIVLKDRMDDGCLGVGEEASRGYEEAQRNFYVQLVRNNSWLCLKHS